MVGRGRFDPPRLHQTNSLKNNESPIRRPTARLIPYHICIASGRSSASQAGRNTHRSRRRRRPNSLVMVLVILGRRVLRRMAGKRHSLLFRNAAFGEPSQDRMAQGLRCGPYDPGIFANGVPSCFDASGLPNKVRRPALDAVPYSSRHPVDDRLPVYSGDHGRTALAIGTIARRFRGWERPGCRGSIRPRLRSILFEVRSKTASGLPAVPSSITMNRRMCSRSSRLAQ